MPLGDITVRPDWQGIEHRQHADRAAQSNALQSGLIVYGLVALGLAAWRTAPPWLGLLQSLLFAATFLWMPVRTAISGAPGRRTTLIVTALVLVAAVILAYFTSPTSLAPWYSLWVARLSPLLSVLVPVTMAVLLLWVKLRHPTIAHVLGLSGRNWGYRAAIGLSLGIALGFHMWIVSAALPQRISLTPAPWPAMIWLLMTGAGLTALGQELALRGALFRMLTAESRGLRGEVFLRTIVLGTPLYIAPVISSAHGAGVSLCLVYGVAFGALALLLRVSGRSIVASLAAGTAFHVFVVLVNLT